MRTIEPQRLREARSFYRTFSRKEMAERLPMRLKLAAWRRGFQAANAAVYGVENIETGLYVSDEARLKRLSLLNPVPALFTNKLILRRLLADRGFTQPETIALVSGAGVLLDPVGSARYAEPLAVEVELRERGGRYIWKPEAGQRGAGIELVEATTDGLVARRGDRRRPFSVPARALPAMLLEAVVEQHEFWRSLCPSSLNTLRILTCWTPGDDAPFVARAVQRIGTQSTMPTDNWSGGGICALVDLESGRLGSGRVNPFKSGREDRPYPRHPETDAPIEGVVLPLWDAIRETTLAAARCIPFATYVGWDIAVDAEGRPVVIEGNKNSDLNLLQVHGGLLAEPRIRRFLEHCHAL